MRNHCSVAGCIKVVAGFGFCKLHYRRFKRGIDPHAAIIPKNTVCTVKGCAQPIKAKSLCGKHLQRASAGKDPNAPSWHDISDGASFLSKFSQSDGCWEWSGGKNDKGYGLFYTKRPNRKTWTAHRFSYHTFVGPIPLALHVLHRCDNPGCVNPAHLFLGTNKDNIDDKVTKGRAASKLAASDIPKIRAMAATMTQAAIAIQFGVKRANISAVLTGRTWGHIP